MNSKNELELESVLKKPNAISFFGVKNLLASVITNGLTMIHNTGLRGHLLVEITSIDDEVLEDRCQKTIVRRAVNWMPNPV